MVTQFNLQMFVTTLLMCLHLMVLSNLCRTQLAKAYKTAAVLFEVLKAVNRDKAEEPPPEVKLSHVLWQCELVFLSTHAICI